jgi:SlyX protein
MSNTGMDIPYPIENRLVDLEIKAGFTEDLLDQLNAQVYRQQQQIDALIQELRQMRDRLPESGGAAEVRNLRDEIPPHY